MNINTTQRHVYFASANSFDGFKSYFDSIFCSADYARIFVLKGGPGTGKSSIMKKLAGFAERKGLYYELFYCSSDPTSLDGITVGEGGKKIAVLDGTAPHERDAVIPGAVDELVNLGEAWDSSKLASHRGEIEYLNKKKSASYKSAYCELSFSFIYWTKYKAEIETLTDKAILNKEARRILSRFDGLNGGKSDIKLLSSFSKKGYTTLPYRDNFKNVFYIDGEYCSKYLILNEIKNELLRSGVKFTVIPSPLDANITEGVILGDDTLLTTDKGDNKLFDAASLINISDAAKAQLSYFSENIKKHLDTAKTHLSQASDYHFSLEAIYTPCMDFSKLDLITENLISKIEDTIKL